MSSRCGACGAKCVPAVDNRGNHYMGCPNHVILDATPESVPNRVVRLRSAKGDVDRVVIAETPLMVRVCRAEELAAARNERRAPRSVFFRKTDIIAES